jgi:hypothetical protein
MTGMVTNPATRTAFVWPFVWPCPMCDLSIIERHSAVQFQMLPSGCDNCGSAILPLRRREVRL